MFAPSTPMRRVAAVALASALVTSGCAAGRDAQTQNQIPTQDGTNANAGSMALRGLSLQAPSSGTSYAPGSAIPLRLVLVNNGISNDKLTNIVTTSARGWASFRTAAQAASVIDQQPSHQTPGSSGPSATGTPGTSPSATTSQSTPSSTTSSGTTSSGTTKTRKKHATKQRTSTSSSASTSTTPATSATTSASTSAAETSVVIPAGQRVSWAVPDSRRVLVLLTSVGRIYPGSSVKLTFTFAKAGSVTVVVPVQTSSDPGDSTISPGPSNDG